MKPIPLHLLAYSTIVTTCEKRLLTTVLLLPVPQETHPTVLLPSISPGVTCIYVSVASGERLSALAGAASSPASIVIIVILLRASAFSSTEGEGP